MGTILFWGLNLGQEFTRFRQGLKGIAVLGWPDLLVLWMYLGMIHNLKLLCFIHLMALSTLQGVHLSISLRKQGKYLKMR